MHGGWRAVTEGGADVALLGPLLVPEKVFRGDAKLVSKYSSQPHSSRHHVLGHTDIPAAKVLRMGKGRVGAHHDAGVPEQALGKYRQADPGRIATIRQHQQ
jgi:hypothetical protein